MIPGGRTMARSSRLVSRRITEVLRSMTVVVAITVVGSRNGGRKLLPMPGYKVAAPSSSMAAMARTAKGWLRARRSQVFLSTHFMPLTNALSLCFFCFLGWSRKEASTGMTVSETTNDAAILTMVAMAMGVNKRPSTPLSASRGTKTKMTRIVA